MHGAVTNTRNGLIELNAIDIHIPGLNFVSGEYLDPVYSLVLSILGQNSGAKTYLLFEVIVLLLTLFLFVRSWGARVKASLLVSISIVILMLGLSGIDPFAGKFHWLPLLFLGLDLLRGHSLSGRFKGALITVVSGSLWLYSSGSLGTLGIVCAGSYFVLGRTKQKDSHDHSKATLANADNAIFLFLCIAGICAAVAICPIYEIPDYPAGARLTPISPLTFQEAPRIGPWLGINTVDFEVLRELSREQVVRFLVLASGLLLLLFTNRRLRSQGLLVVLAFLVLIIDAWIPPQFYDSLSPFQSIRRLVPGMSLNYFPWLCLPFALIVVSPAIAKHTSDRVLWSFCASLFSLCIGAQLCYPFVLSTSEPSLGHFAFAPYLDRALAPQQNETFTSKDLIKFSPSYLVVKAYGNWVLDEQNPHRRDISQLQKLSLAQAIADADLNSEKAQAVLSGKGDSRWSIGRPQSAGDEFRLILPEAITIGTCALSVKDTPTDFPRGIKVLGSLDGIEYTTLFEQTPWLGPVKWSDKGYPYFGPQSEVVIRFTEPRMVKYLKFIQTGQDKTFDWSIQQIRLFSQAPS